MPHLTLEYSANLAQDQTGHERGDGIATLCKTLAQCLASQRENDQPVFPLGGIRVRALRCDQYWIADGRPGAAFLHANLKIAAGRSDTAKAAAGDALFDLIKQHFAKEFEAHGLALSLEINEFSETGTWKHNNLHARLKA